MHKQVDLDHKKGQWIQWGHICRTIVSCWFIPVVGTGHECTETRSFPVGISCILNSWRSTGILWYFCLHYFLFFKKNCFCQGKIGEIAYLTPVASAPLVLLPPFTANSAVNGSKELCINDLKLLSYEIPNLKRHRVWSVYCWLCAPHYYYSSSPPPKHEKAGKGLCQAFAVERWATPPTLYQSPNFLSVILLKDCLLSVCCPKRPSLATLPSQPACHPTHQLAASMLLRSTGWHQHCITC